MNIWKTLFLSLVVIMLILSAGAGIFWIEVRAEQAALQTKLDQRENDLVAQRLEFEKQLSDQQAESQKELQGQKEELEAAADKKLQEQEVNFEEALKTLTTKYDEALVSEFQRGVKEGEANGYSEGYLEDKVVLENPTYAGLTAFLESTVLFPLPTDCCVDFAANLNNAAEEMGIRAGYVFLVDSYVDDGKWGHFLNCFETVDEGLVYVEPQTMTDVTAEVAVGKLYKYNGRAVKEIIIIW